MRDRERETFPRLKDDLGEDPARYLDRPRFDGVSATSSPLEMARARIRGIDDISTARAWLAVERNIDRGPRDDVIEWIEDRIEELEEHGERPPLGPDCDGWDRPEITLPDTPSISERWSVDGGSDALGEGQHAATGDDPAASDAAELDEFGLATDGGESQ